MPRRWWVPVLLDFQVSERVFSRFQWIHFGPDKGFTSECEARAAFHLIGAHPLATGVLQPVGYETGGELAMVKA